MNIAKRLLRKVGIVKQPAVQAPAGVNCLGKRVVAVNKLGLEDVYCLDVPETNCFFANGIVVHNCLDSLRYAVYTHFFGKEQSRMTAAELDRLYNEAMGGGYDLPAPFRDTTSYPYFPVV